MIQTETNNHIRDFLTKIVTELQFLKEAGSRTEGILQAVQVEMARKLAMHSVETMEGALKVSLGAISARLSGTSNTKQLLDETNKAVEDAAQSSRNAVLGIQTALRVLSTLDRESITVALASLKLSTSGEQPSVFTIGRMSSLDERGVSRAVDHLLKESVAGKNCVLNEPFSSALSYVLSSIEEYPGMRFQERVNAILECLKRSAQSN